MNFGPQPLYFGHSELNPSASKFRMTSWTRSSLVNATFAIAGTSMPYAAAGTTRTSRPPCHHRSRVPAGDLSPTKSQPVATLKGSPSQANVVCCSTSELRTCGAIDTMFY